MTTRTNTAMGIGNVGRRMNERMLLNLDSDGICVCESFLDSIGINSLIAEFEKLAHTTEPQPSARVRRGVVFARRNLLQHEFVQQLIVTDAVRSVLRKIAPACVAVRALLFDKTGDANWTVPWHQDRSIAVAERADVPGFGPWSEKAGVIHVQPPVELLKQMATLRFSLDSCGEDNGPLRAIPGSHHDILDREQIAAAVKHGPEVQCTTAPGGLVIMRPLLLHASSPAKEVTHRRVLHIEFGPRDLPGGLRWAMV